MTGMLKEDSPVMGVTEAAQVLEVDRATITRWLRSGKLVARDKLPGGNGAWLLTRASVMHLAAQRRKGN